MTPEQMLSLATKPLFREWSPRAYRNIPGVFGNNWFDDFVERTEYTRFWHPYDLTMQHAEMETPCFTSADGTIHSARHHRQLCRYETKRGNST